MFPNGGVTAPTRGRPRPLPVISSTGTSPPNGPMRSGSRTSPRSRPGMGRCTSPRRSTVTTARSSRTRPGPVPTRSSPTGCSSRPWKRCRRERGPGAFRPRMPLPVARMAGAHGPLRPGAVDGRQRPFPGRRRRGGVPRTHEDGARLSWALGGHTRDGVLVPIDDCIRWHDHERIKRSIGWMSPVQIPSKPGNSCVIISKKTSAAPP